MQKTLSRLIYRTKNTQMEFIYNENKSIIFAKSITVMDAYDDKSEDFKSLPIYTIDGYGIISSQNELREIPYYPDFNSIKGKVGNFKLINIFSNAGTNQCVAGSFNIKSKKQPYFSCNYSQGKVYKEIENFKPCGPKNKTGINLEAETRIKKFIGKDIEYIKHSHSNEIVCDEVIESFQQENNFNLNL